MVGKPWVGLLLVAVGTVGYSQDAPPPPPPPLAEASSGSKADHPPLVKNTNPEYVIAPDDLLDVDVFDYPELTRTVRVSSDGTIELPLLGQLKAAGLTAPELRKEIASSYTRTYLKDPQVTVAVRESHGQLVSVIGAVGKPGLYQLGGSRSLIDVLSLAGGPSNLAGRSVLVARSGGFELLPDVEGMRQVAPDQVEINLNRLLYAHEGALNLQIKPLDMITIAKADIIYVVGAVRNSAGFVLADRESVTVLQAVAMAGGLGGTASKKGARIIRRGADGAKTEIPLDLGRILSGKSEDLMMAANDILFVPDSMGKSAAKRGAEAVIGVVGGLIIYRR